MRRDEARSIGRRLAAVTVLVALLLGLAAAWPQIDAWARSAALFGDVVVRLPVRPLTWVIGDPSTEPIEWGASGGRGLLTRPAGAGPAPALVLLLGADPAPPDDSRVERLVDGLARLGFVVLFPLSDALEAKRVTPVEVERLVEAFLALERDPGVLPERVAFVGLSAGGSLAIVAASDERIAERVWFVHAIGPYFDATSLAASALGRAYRTPDGEVRAWEAERVTREVVRETLLSTLPDQDRQALEAADFEGAESLLAALPPAPRDAMRAVSPRYAIGRLRAPLYLLHDRNDRFVPWTESEALARVYEPAIYHRIDLFEHVDPQPGNVPVLFRDGWRLLRLFARIFEQAR